MPYQLIVHWSDVKSEVVATGTLLELAEAKSGIATKVTSKKARWETKFVPAAVVISPAILSSQLGVNGHAAGVDLDAELL